MNKDSYLVLDTLPPEYAISLCCYFLLTILLRYDARVKAMEVDEKPTEDYSDVGGLDKQIQELVEAVVLPITHHDRFEAIGIQPPKGTTLLAFALTF